MSETRRCFVPSHPLPARRTGVLTGSIPDPDTRGRIPVAPQFRALPVDIVFEKDVAVQLRDGVTIYVDVFRPAGATRCPSSWPGARTARVKARR